MAERVVGHGSFGLVFQVFFVLQLCGWVYFPLTVWGCESTKFDLVIKFKSISLNCYFNVVIQAKCLETGETVAIKKVLQDKRYKNRELQTMRLLDHPNIVSLKHCFFSTTEKDELYLNLVLEYVPETVHRVIKHYSKMNQRMPLIYVKLYSYQVCFAHFSPLLKVFFKLFIYTLYLNCIALPAIPTE